MWRIALLLALSSTALAGPDDVRPSSAGTNSLRVYVGTYTGPKSRGIYLLELDPALGVLTSRGLVGETENPSFLAIPPGGRALYAVNEVSNFQGKNDGAVSAFLIDGESGKLKPLNQQSSRGAGPCHLVVDRAGKNVLVANYGGGSVAALPIEQDGRLGPARGFLQHAGSSVNPQRQEGPHAHCIVLDPANRFALAADLGLDQVLVDRFDPAMGTLEANNPPSTRVAPGAGPRHLAFHPDGRRVFVINEINSTLTAFAYDATRGTLEELQTLSTLPEGYRGSNSTAEVQVHPSGRFVYGSNRGHDSIAIFAIDATHGKLVPSGHQSTLGKTPRNFNIDPSGNYLLAANQESGTVAIFRIDPRTGQLRPSGQIVEVPSPVCVEFVRPAE